MFKKQDAGYLGRTSPRFSLRAARDLSNPGKRPEDGGVLRVMIVAPEALRHQGAFCRSREKIQARPDIRFFLNRLA